ncbi:unnamed protein product [Caenorhabditis angaria]|uniref:Uncharacterized protein n=1 Tax=Caenorhabditis angaria TaxID=860376 RepID=A0A9P1N4T7_9PELO|nr:unnamed protein product [Caenorhabditis angaria]
MSENQVIVLRIALETYVGGEKLKVADKDETHRTTVCKIKNEMFDEILDLGTLSKYIFKAAHQEICENVLKFEEKAVEGSKSDTKIKYTLYSWFTTWQRIQVPELDPTVLENYTKTIIELLKSVKLDVFELTGYGYAELAISSLKKSINGRMERNLWVFGYKH